MFLRHISAKIFCISRSIIKDYAGTHLFMITPKHSIAVTLEGNFFLLKIYYGENEEHTSPSYHIQKPNTTRDLY